MRRLTFFRSSSRRMSSKVRVSLPRAGFQSQGEGETSLVVAPVRAARSCAGSPQMGPPPSRNAAVTTTRSSPTARPRSGLLVSRACRKKSAAGASRSCRCHRCSCRTAVCPKPQRPGRVRRLGFSPPPPPARRLRAGTARGPQGRHSKPPPTSGYTEAPKTSRQTLDGFGLVSAESGHDPKLADLSPD